MFKLSVVIPVYNVEKYLNQCIDSVIDKHISNIEIILVDDGSIDNSSEICDFYVNEYNFINVIHKINGGSSSARNTGISIVNSNYIMFIDSDDWWNPQVDMNNILSYVSNDKEVEMFQLSSLDYIEGEGLYKRKEHYNLSNIRTDSIENYYSDLLNNGNLEVHAATKILKTDFIKNNHLLFKEGITSEDNEWMLRVLCCLKKVSIIDEPLYIYRANRNDSISNNIKFKNIEDLLNIIKNSIHYSSLETDDIKFENEFCFCSYLWFCALGLSSKCSNDEIASLKNSFKNTSIVCKCSNSPKTKLAYNVYKHFGLSFTRYILGKYLQLKKLIKLNKKRVDKG